MSKDKSEDYKNAIARNNASLDQYYASLTPEQRWATEVWHTAAIYEPKGPGMFGCYYVGQGAMVMLTDGTAAIINRYYRPHIQKTWEREVEITDENGVRMVQDVTIQKVKHDDTWIDLLPGYTQDGKRISSWDEIV